MFPPPARYRARYATDGRLPPLHELALERPAVDAAGSASASRGRRRSRPSCPPAAPGPAAAAPGSRCRRRRVYSSRSVAAEQRGRDLAGRQPDAEPERLAAPRPAQRASSSAWRRCIATAARAARSAWSSCGNGAPNTAITASPTYCITVPPCVEDRRVHLGPVLVELPGEHGRVGALGDARVAADVGHQHGDDRAARSARCAAPSRAASRPARRAAAGSASRPAPRGRRSPSAAGAAGAARPPRPALAPWASSRKSARSRRSTASGVVPAATAMALTGRPSATWRRSSSSSLGQLAVVARPGATSASHDLGVEHRAAGRDLADGPGELVAVAHPVLEQVGVAGGAFG